MFGRVVRVVVKGVSMSTPKPKPSAVAEADYMSLTPRWWWMVYVRTVEAFRFGFEGSAEDLRSENDVAHSVQRRTLQIGMLPRLTALASWAGYVLPAHRGESFPVARDDRPRKRFKTVMASLMKRCLCSELAGLKVIGTQIIASPLSISPVLRLGWQYSTWQLDAVRKMALMLSSLGSERRDVQGAVSGRGSQHGRTLVCSTPDTLAAGKPWETNGTNLRAVRKAFNHLTFSLK